MALVESSSRAGISFEHDLLGKPAATFPDHALHLADRRFDQRQAVGVDRRHRIVARLIAGELEHFLFMAHGGAARARLVAEISIVVEMRAAADRFDMARIGARHADRHPLQRAREIRRRQIACAVTGCFGIGDVLGEHSLAFLVPLRAGTQHGEYRKIGNRHRLPLF